jgi:heat shock protein HslJ
MYCEGVMDSESEFNTTFATVKSFRLEGERLSLLDADGQVVLVFGAPQPPPSLEGASWTIIQVGELSAPAGAEATLVFAQGQATGRAACNNYFASFTQDGTALSFGPPGATKMFCSEEGVMAFEAAFLESLEKVRTFTIETGRLVLLDESGAPLAYLALQ